LWLVYSPKVEMKWTLSKTIKTKMMNITV